MLTSKIPNALGFVRPRHAVANPSTVAAIAPLRDTRPAPSFRQADARIPLTTVEQSSLDKVLRRKAAASIWGKARQANADAEQIAKMEARQAAIVDEQRLPASDRIWARARRMNAADLAATDTDTSFTSAAIEGADRGADAIWERARQANSEQGA